jgi:hypothetical protein
MYTTETQFDLPACVSSNYCLRSQDTGGHRGVPSVDKASVINTV